MAGLLRSHGAAPTGRVGSTGAGGEHVLVHYPAQPRAQPQEVLVRVRHRHALRCHHRVLLLHLLEGAPEQTQAGGTE
ncbi:unnamed protein product [Leptidea sinapis]|uniref:Uncharacterized protein n=1 Tax=Leptidea sinapis TaxID=189913 RepID=A0A5E4QMY7_9NEOP|nr:unnamed protein product [Leptidea sinapis]